MEIVNKFGDFFHKFGDLLVSMGHILHTFGNLLHPPRIVSSKFIHDEILLDIFHFLKAEELYLKIALVCKRYNSIIISEGVNLPKREIYELFISEIGDIYIRPK